MKNNNVKLVADKLNDFWKFDDVTHNDGVYELTGFGKKIIVRKYGCDILAKVYVANDALDKTYILKDTEGADTLSEIIIDGVDGISTTWEDVFNSGIDIVLENNIDVRKILMEWFEYSPLDNVLADSYAGLEINEDTSLFLKFRTSGGNDIRYGIDMNGFIHKGKQPVIHVSPYSLDANRLVSKNTAVCLLSTIQYLFFSDHGLDIMFPGEN